MQNKNNKIGVIQVTEFHEETETQSNNNQQTNKQKQSGWKNDCTYCNLDRINALRPARSPFKYSS